MKNFYIGKEKLLEIGRRIKFIRSKLNMTQEKFSEKTGISSSFLSFIESGKKKPSFELLYALSNQYSININWLLTGVENFSHHSKEKPSVWEIYPNLPKDQLINDLLVDLEVPIMYHSIASKYLSFKNEYEELIHNFFNLKEEKAINETS